MVDFYTSVYNQPTMQLTGRTAEEILNYTLLEAYPEIGKSGLFDLYVKVLETGELAYHEISGLGSAETTLAFLITRQVDKKGIVVTALDISKRKQAETMLYETAESLQAVLELPQERSVFSRQLTTKMEKLSISTWLFVTKNSASHFKNGI